MGLDFKEKMGKWEVYEVYVRNTCSNWLYMRTFLLMLTYLLSFLSKETSLRTILFFLGGVGTTMTTTMGCPATSLQRGSRRSPNAVPTDPSPAIARTPRREVPGTATTQWRSQPGACMETQLCLLVGVTSTSICNIYIDRYVYTIYICIYNIRTLSTISPTHCNYKYQVTYLMGPSCS
jgi:hypothetical protein